MPDNAKLDESIVLETILNYKEFNQFYRDNRSKIPYEISWYKDLDPEVYNEACSDLGSHEIHIKSFPESKTDAFIIAHEILHFARAHKILPLILHVTKYSNLATSLLSLLEDPVVDSILKTQYDFNLRPLYMKGIENGKRKVGNEFADDIDRVSDGFIHASWILKWRLIEDKNALKSWRTYQKRLEYGRPKAYKIGFDTVAIIDDVGLGTIERQKIIANKLIDVYKLQEILSIGDWR